MTDGKITDVAGLREDLFTLMLDAEREGSVAMLCGFAAAHGYQAAVGELLEPVLERIGEEWCRERISLAQGYVAGKIAEDVLLAAASSHGDLLLDEKGPVVLGNVEDDYHSLGRKMVCIFLRAAGWRVIDLGNDVPPAEFVEAAVTNGARVIGVSAMMLTTAENIRDVRAELDARGLSGKLQLAVGGAVFKLRPELVHEIGGDGTVPSAIQAPALFDRLWAASLAGEDA